VRRLIASAPGRICLLGEHQDYFGLDVISGATALRLRVIGRPNDCGLLRIDMPDIGARAALEIDRELAYAGPRDYLRSCVNVLRRQGRRLEHGWDVRITSTIPVGKGTSSSSALVMAWLRFLLAAGGELEEPDPEWLAWLGHECEVLEFGEPGGMQDHFAMAFGGLIHLRCSEPFAVTRLPREPRGFLLVDSLAVKDTVGVIGRIKQGVRTALERLYPGESRPFDHLRAMQRNPEKWAQLGIPEEPRRLLAATLETREITARGLGLLQGEWTPEALAALIREQQRVLREGLGVSTPRIETLMERAYAAGALACKVNGSGGGGCFLVYAPGKVEQVAEAIRAAGGVPLACEFDRGVQLQIEE
jgi:galactokinase